MNHEIPDEIRKNSFACFTSLNAAERAVVMYGEDCLLYTSPSPRDATLSRMPSSA